MKHFKKLYKIIAMVMILSVVTPYLFTNAYDTVAYAATVKLNKNRYHYMLVRHILLR